MEKTFINNFLIFKHLANSLLITLISKYFLNRLIKILTYLEKFIESLKTLENFLYLCN